MPPDEGIATYSLRRSVVGLPNISVKSSNAGNVDDRLVRLEPLGVLQTEVRSRFFDEAEGGDVVDLEYGKFSSDRKRYERKKRLYLKHELESVVGHGVEHL